MEILLLVIVGLFLAYFWLRSLFNGAQRKDMAEEVKGFFLDKIRGSRISVKTGMAEKIVESKKVFDDLGLNLKELKDHKNLLDSI